MVQTKNSSAQNAPHDLVYEENSILHGIINGGKEALLDCVDLLDERYFDQLKNKIIYSAIKEIFNDGTKSPSQKLFLNQKILGLIALMAC